MIRQHLSEQLDHDPNFRWRGEAVTRIENLSDIVFALALGMLVSASDPPQTFGQLIPHLVNIVPVAAGFAFLLMIWNAHFTYFRRYGVADTYILFLNAVLLLFILFIAYPLRFAFDSLFAFILGAGFDQWGRMDEMGISTYLQAGIIIAWLNAGLTLIYILLHQMYAHALHQADRLGLSASERAMTRRSIWRYRCRIVVYAAVAVLAGFTLLGPFAAMIILIIWPLAIVIRRFIPLPTVDQ